MINLNDHILITGGSGFLGGFIYEELFKRGFRNMTILSSKHVDLKSEEETKTVFRILRPKVVIHAAAVCGGIGANKDKPDKFLSDNARINLNVVDSCCSLFKSGTGFKKFVGLGSVCSYPKFTPIPFKEDDLWNGYPEETNAPYGLSKRLLLAHIQACRQRYDFPGVFLLPVNLYGPGDNFDPRSSHVIPAIILKVARAIREKRDHIVCWGTGNASREFFHAQDAASGICDAMEKYNGNDPVNLGNGTEITIKDLTEKIVYKMDFLGEIKWDHSKPDGQPRRCLDVSRAKEYFGFTAKINLDEGLQQTINWFNSNKEAQANLLLEF